MVFLPVAAPGWNHVLQTASRAGFFSGLLKAGRWPDDGRDPYLLETSMPGIFACGDVRFSPVKRVASAVGEGSMAIAFVHQYLRLDGARAKRVGAEQLS
jgi:thioredoxin reductase